MGFDKIQILFLDIFIFRKGRPLMGDLMSRISKQLHSDERILWNGKPILTPFIFSGTHLVIFLAGIGFSVIAISQFVLPMIMLGTPIGFLIIPLLFPTLGIAFAFGTPLRSFFAHRNTEYIITDQRLITQTGAFGVDTRFIEFKKIQEVTVQIGFVDKLFGTGSIFVDTASVGSTRYSGYHGGYPYIRRPNVSSIREPYKIQKILQNAIKNNSDLDKKT
jgi:membrane protein YdbS with pleckstrin-like domain